MNKYRMYKTPLLFIMVMLVSFAANAQKQPQKQEISVRAPINVKIDGKLNEWPNPYLNAHASDAYLNAYNSLDRIYYTISNDDNNLYLAMRGLGTRVADKALRWGITITISHSVEKKTRAKAADNVTITFPVPQDGKTVSYMMGPIFNLNEFLDDSVTHRKQIDSILAIANKRINDAMKKIKIVGVKEITDTIISIYNTERIKAAAQFIKRQPVFELAIPLKYLGLSINNPVKFSYNIKFNAPPPPDSEELPLLSNDDAVYVALSTDFWGEYTLANK